MRSHFLATTGLMAAALVLSSAANAAEPITLSVGGKLRQFFYVTDQDNAPGQDLGTTAMTTNAEVYFDGKTVLDNGIEVRAVMELEAESRNDRNADELYVEFTSGLGKLRVGEKEGVNALLIGAAPQAFMTTEEEVIGDAIRPRTGAVIRDAFTFKRYSNDFLGVSYETPDIAGFKFGATYNPSISDAEGVIDAAQTVHNGIDISGRYETKFTGGKVLVAAGYFHSESRNGGNNGQEGWNATINVTYGGWEVGGGYAASNPANSLDERAWNAGAMYSIGPYKISANYTSVKREPTPNAARKEKIDNTVLQGTYRIGPGINLGLAGFYTEQSDAAGVNWDGVGMMSGVKLAF